MSKTILADVKHDFCYDYYSDSYKKIEASKIILIKMDGLCLILIKFDKYMLFLTQTANKKQIWNHLIMSDFIGSYFRSDQIWSDLENFSPG